MDKQPCVYILAKDRNDTLYIGVTSNLSKRLWQHQNHVVDGFTHKYVVRPLVYFELHSDMTSAITREKQIKRWNRMWKLRLIETANPEWRDLSIELGLTDTPPAESKTGFPPARE